MDGLFLLPFVLLQCCYIHQLPFTTHKSEQRASGPEGNNCAELSGSRDCATAECCTTVYSSVAFSLLLLGIVVPSSSMVRKIEEEVLSVVRTQKCS